MAPTHSIALASAIKLETYQQVNFAYLDGHANRRKVSEDDHTVIVERADEILVSKWP
jgi:prepilin-type processing-associated H-X9-DG protein